MEVSATSRFSFLVLGYGCFVDSLGVRGEVV